MLPTNSSSSIQRRRQQHRRQQSLEVPILAPPLPTTNRRTNPGRHSHRRGLSLDQSLPAHSSPGFRPLQSDTPGLPHGTTARIQPNTNTGLTPDQQHYIKQEPQEHSLAQPGFPPPAQAPPAQARDFQSHLQQQLNGIFNQPYTSSNMEHAAAMQNLQHHMMWYQENFGAASTNPNMPGASFVRAPHPDPGEMDASVFMSQSSAPTMQSTSSAPGHAQTVPNTPQHYTTGWPSPPPSHMKHTRSHSYQLDVAPMQQAFENIAFAGQNSNFNSSSFGLGADQDYDPSVYSSSVADPSSPPHQHGMPMPTLYEETTSRRQTHGRPTADALLLEVAAGADLDFNSPHFVVGGRPVCPEQQALDAAGIDATYIDTGVSEEEISSWLSNPTKKGDAYVCKFDDCNAKVNRKENARSHVQNHLNDRKFRCNPCGKRFTRMHDTKRHFLTHTNERPAICPCGRSFARADALTRHRQRDMCEGVLPGFEKAEEDKPKRGRPKKDRSGEMDKTKKRTHRPDMETRTQKAAFTRSMEHSKAASSSSALSEHSLPDTPPQDSDAMDTADFLNTNGAESQFNTAARSWLDTPPTSPPSISPTKSINSKVVIDLRQDEGISPSKLSNGSSPTATTGIDKAVNDFSSPATFHNTTGFVGESSPIDDEDDRLFNGAVNFDDIMDTHPGVGHHSGVFSPPGESCSGSSVFNSDFDTIHVSHPVKMANYNNSSMHFNPNMHHNGFSSDVDDFIGTGEEDMYSDVRDILDCWISTH